MSARKEAETLAKRPRVLDLYCCQGGASRGYEDAGYAVVGVDIKPQARYPYPFAEIDALEALQILIGGHYLYSNNLWWGLDDFDLIHASPPCQARTRAQKIQGNIHPNLIAPTRELLYETGLPFVIENVVTDKANDPDPLLNPVMLCGAMFGLETYRHREFEIAFPSFAAYKAFTVPEHPEHVARTTKMGRPPQPGEYMHVVGNFSGVDKAREVMGMPWASRDGLREAIPPAYTEFIGAQLLNGLERAA